jgi:hypothetical protein
VDARVLDITTYDLILGMDWLELYSPMTCDWLLKWIEFDYQGQRVKLQGLLPIESETLSEISGEQVHKLAKGNDIWALVAVFAEQVDITKQEPYLVNGIPGAVQEVIHANADLFEAPHTLPPSREFDHSISLYPDSVPVNYRPYRYTPQQKDKIERQVGNMLQVGLVTPSLSLHYWILYPYIQIPSR